MTEDEAVALMVDGGFQEEAEARAKYDRARLSSTQLSTYFAGSMEMWEIELEARRRAAAAGADPTAIEPDALPGGFGETPGFRYRPHLEAVIGARRPADVAAAPDPVRLRRPPVAGRAARGSGRRRSLRPARPSSARSARSHSSLGRFGPSGDRRAVRAGPAARRPGSRPPRRRSRGAPTSASSGGPPLSIASRRTAQRRSASNRSRSSHSTPCQRVDAHRGRGSGRARASARAAGVAARPRPRTCDGRGRASRTRTRLGGGPRLALVEARRAEAGGERPGRGEARRTRPRSSPRRRRPAPARPVRDSASQPSRPPARPGRGRRPIAAKARSRPDPDGGRRRRPDRPVTPVACGDGRQEVREASLERGRGCPPRPSHRGRPRRGRRRRSPGTRAWTGSSCSSRSASSSDGTPPPASRSASRRHCPASRRGARGTPRTRGPGTPRAPAAGRAPRSRGTSAGTRGPFGRRGT